MGKRRREEREGYMCRERGKRTKTVLIIERMNRERKRNKKLGITGKYD